VALSKPAAFPPPHGLDQIKMVYGDIRVASGQVVAPRDWESDNMIMVFDLPGVPVRRLYVNKHVEPSLRAALAACVALNDGYVIRTIGCFAPRAKRVNGELSVHSWGAAIDINADTNPLSLDGVLRRDIPDAWVAEFEKRGWTWGGRWKKPDAMHFQYVSGY
jgi:hypothetical protein